MRKERRNSSQPSLIDRLQLKASFSRRVDGVWIGAYFSPTHLYRVEEALGLIRQYSPLQYSRIAEDLQRIWIFLIPDGLASYRHSLRACVLDERFVADAATSVERIASTIVHEATHARLERYGIPYEEATRARIEAICSRRELAFALCLPDGLQLQEEILQYLDWYPVNPDFFGDTQIVERHANGEVAMLRHVGLPAWLIPVTLKFQSIIRWTRSVFQARSRISEDRQPTR
jgi:hypothetical protein